MSDYISGVNIGLIFKYLPAKTLLRFRCVCKGCKQLIDSPDFVQDHLSVQKPQFIVDYGGRKYLVADPRPRPLVHTLSKPIEKEEFVLVGTLHGVVCLYATFKNIVLWNPSIRRFSSLALPSGFKRWFRPLQACYGFWIDPSSKEFKIVIFLREPEVNCILYSSTRGDWSVIITAGKLANLRSCNEGPPVLIGGVAHWVGCLDDSMDHNHWEHEHGNKVILSFDFVQESFDVIEIPSLRYYSTAPCRWQGMLSLVCWDDQYPRRCKIYLRQEDSWVELFSFEIFESIVRTFWVMEDMEEIKKKGKRKRKMDMEMEETIMALMGDERGNVRVLATIISDTETMIGELVLDGPKTGCKALKKGLRDYENVNMAYDFVESLLFP